MVVSYYVTHLKTYKLYTIKLKDYDSLPKACTCRQSASLAFKRVLMPLITFSTQTWLTEFLGSTEKGWKIALKLRY